jgi:hypothetical protein
MQSLKSSRPSLGRREEGIALIVTLLVMMLVSVLMVGFVASIIADTRASGLDRDQTQAYAAAHAGLEQVTTDLSAVFNRDPSPSGTTVAALRNNPPAMPGYAYIAPGGAVGSGYMVAPRFPALVAGNGLAVGDPTPEDVVNGSAITAGPYQGLRGIITPYDITITARACPEGPPCTASIARGGAEVRMRRTLQTVAIPVFQFGMFSETDLAFHAGEIFSFGGRVHTNGNLFLANADGATLTLMDRVTAFRDVIRTHLPNGLLTTSNYEGTVRVPTLIAANPANNQYRNLARNEGSLQGTIGSLDNTAWAGLSTGTYLNNIRNGDTGAKRLDLPLVADLDGNGAPDAEPIELIRRPVTANENTTNEKLYVQRFYSQASMRILLSDDAADITSLPTIDTVNGAPVNLGAVASYGPPGLMRAPLARSALLPTVVEALGTLPANIYKSTDAPLINGFIKIEVWRTDLAAWRDVTLEILNLGIAGRNLADRDVNNPATFPPTSTNGAWNRVPDSTADVCWEPHPNAVIRLQRVRDVPFGVAASTSTTSGVRCGVTFSTSPTVNGVSQRATDYWPLALYDTREGQTRDNLSGQLISMGGIMHYVELDVNNLKRWLAGNIGTTNTPTPQVKNDNGYIVYFSDRRNNNTDTTLLETGEYGFEDGLTSADASASQNGTIQTGEDLNTSGTVEVYGRNPRNTPTLGAIAPFTSTARPWTQVTGTNGTGTTLATTLALNARANRTLFFRRALKLVNGGIVPVAGVPTSNLPTAGLTVVSENPVYVQGNYNATAASTTGAGNVPAAIIADAVTTLSNNWNDIRSFTDPTDSLQRPASETGYRMAIVSGKGIAFPQPAGTSSSFGSDGGAHNFIRLLEQWDNGSWHRYRGSMVSLFINRQAIGTFKCCSQDAYNRGDRDWSFDTDFLLPARLPPGTPMFRDVNTLTFRQLLRPTQ